MCRLLHLFLAGQKFEPEAVRNMGARRLRPPAPDLVLLIALIPQPRWLTIKIIELAKCGVLDKETLLKQTLSEFNIRD